MQFDVAAVDGVAPGGVDRSAPQSAIIKDADLMHRFLTAVAVTVSLSAPAYAQVESLERLGAYVDALRVQAGIPGLAAALVGTDAILWEQAFGRQDLERTIATRTDTPFHIDGLTQLLTATIVLRCVEEGRLSLDDRIGTFKPTSPDADATIGQLLTHTYVSQGGLAFAYRPDRLEPLARAIRACTDNSFRETVATQLERLAMIDSVPGPDVVYPELLDEGVPTASQVDRYKRALARLAVPYAVERRGAAERSQYSARTLAPGGGLVSTVRDLAQFDLALKNGLLLRTDTLAAAWRPPAGPDGRTLPHGHGWWVQSFNGQTIVWQFGMSPNAGSAILMMLPARGVTLILLANSDGLARPFALERGDLTTSPFVRLFLRLIVR
jgi:CubicO group peptidase (beta-lactamase class C family)